MSQTVEFVVLDDTTTYGQSGGAKVLLISDEAVLDAIASGEYEDADEFSDKATLAIDIPKLLHIVWTAQAVLESECGVQSMSELATAFELAGIVGKGYYTDLYGEAVDEPEEPTDD